MNLFRKVIWFKKRLKFDIDYFDYLQPQRVVNGNPRYNHGIFYSKKCGRDIQYESGIELEFIKQLESSSRVKFYYEQPVTIPYWRGKIKQNYTPDFAVYLITREVVLVEIKELSSMADDRVQMKIEGLIKFCSIRGFGLLFTDGRNTIDKITRPKLNGKLEKEILYAVENHIILKAESEEIRKRCNATQNELLKVILKNGLRFKPFPFKLRQGRTNIIFRHVFVHNRPYEELNEKYFSSLFISKESLVE